MNARENASSSFRIATTIAVIEAFNSPRRTSARLAQLFAQHRSVNIVVCHWSRLKLTQERWTVTGAVYKATAHGELKEEFLTGALPVDSMYFYGPDAGLLTNSDQSSLGELAASGIDITVPSKFGLVDQIMQKASRRGVVSNALGPSRVWGPKHEQELRLRRYEASSVEHISRPRTHIARPHEFHAVLSLFQANGETCIVKPSFLEGGTDIVIVQPGNRLPPPLTTVVVQQLIENPWLVDGHKADIRFYLVIDLRNEATSTRIGPILVRKAGAPYFAGSKLAEITNRSFLASIGLAPDIRLIEDVLDIDGSCKREIIRQLDSMAHSLIRAFFWDRRRGQTDGSYVSNNILLFGIDAVVAMRSQKPKTYFLEVNPLPALFSGLRECDSAMDDMLLHEYLPKFI